jgi:hypothetical protein
MDQKREDCHKGPWERREGDRPRGLSHRAQKAREGPDAHVLMAQGDKHSLYPMVLTLCVCGDHWVLMLDILVFPRKWGTWIQVVMLNVGGDPGSK